MSDAELEAAIINTVVEERGDIFSLASKLDFIFYKMRSSDAILGNCPFKVLKPPLAIVKIRDTIVEQACIKIRKLSLELTKGITYLLKHFGRFQLHKAIGILNEIVHSPIAAIIIYIAPSTIPGPYYT